MRKEVVASHRLIIYIDYLWERYILGCIFPHMPPRFLLQVTESFSNATENKPETQPILNKVCTKPVIFLYTIRHQKGCYRAQGPPLGVGDFDFFWILQGLGMEDPSFTIPHDKKWLEKFFWLMTVEDFPF